MQFLSEPSGGSDVAGALTTAVRDGDEWVLNGSKVWTTGAWWSDWGLCLARTNWDVPKHRGLTVFMLPIHQPGIEVHRIEMLNGSKEFCQEFLTDVRRPRHRPDRRGRRRLDGRHPLDVPRADARPTRRSSPCPAGMTARGRWRVLVTPVAREAGRLDDPYVRDLVGEARMLDVVDRALRRRIGEGIATGPMPDQSAAIGRLFTGVASARIRTIAFEIAGAAGAAGPTTTASSPTAASDFLMRQVSCIGGGTTEMARNVISERVLGMPRERTLDRDVAFREVRRNASPG